MQTERAALKIHAANPQQHVQRTSQQGIPASLSPASRGRGNQNLNEGSCQRLLVRRDSSLHFNRSRGSIWALEFSGRADYESEIVALQKKR